MAFSPFISLAEWFSLMEMPLRALDAPDAPLRDAVPQRSIGSECSGRPAARLRSRLQLIAGNVLLVAAQQQAGWPRSWEVTAHQPEPSLGSSAARHAAPRDHRIIES